jgi:hypothetical protein
VQWKESPIPSAATSPWPWIQHRPPKAAQPQVTGQTHGTHVTFDPSGTVRMLIACRTCPPAAAEAPRGAAPVNLMPGQAAGPLLGMQQA